MSSGHDYSHIYFCDEAGLYYCRTLGMNTWELRDWQGVTVKQTFYMDGTKCRSKLVRIRDRDEFVLKKGIVKSPFKEAIKFAKQAGRMPFPFGKKGK